MTADLYQQIVDDLESAGKNSPYQADANEPDPRYLGYGVRQKGKSVIIKKYAKVMKSLSEAQKVALGLRLIESHYGEQQEVGLYLFNSMYRYFSAEKMPELDHIIRNLYGWSKIDTACGHLLRNVLANEPAALLTLVEQWNQDPDLWPRRASVVLFTRKVAKSGTHTDFALRMCDDLKFDPEDLVQKAVGWCLKDLMFADEPRIIQVVKQMRAAGVSSTITLYAIRNIKGSLRAEILAH